MTASATDGSPLHAGAVLYNIGCTTNLCDQFPSVALTPEAQFWMATMTFVVGGVGFLVAGFLYVVDREGAGFIRGARSDQSPSAQSWPRAAAHASAGPALTEGAAACVCGRGDAARARARRPLCSHAPQGPGVPGLVGELVQLVGRRWVLHERRVSVLLPRA